MGGGAKNPNGEIFTISGPFHLTSIDWTNSYYRAAVLSSLVNGVYTLERDRQKKRIGLESRAKPWWEFFHFILLKTLIDPKDKSIYGAIFEYESYNQYQNTPYLERPPRYVIAFRGTSLKRKALLCDAILDLRIVFNTLDGAKRLMHAIEAINTMVNNNRESAIWLAGHSLGAGIALLAGKAMLKSEFLLETYLFNPPISSIPLEQLLKSERLKSVFRITKTVVKATIAMLLKDLQEDNPKTASWIPYLYVNPADAICSEYIGDFRHKTFMSKIGASKIERTAARISLRSGTSSPYFLSSADMTVNMNKPTKSKTAHGLDQWWEQDLTPWASYCIRPKP